MLQNNVQPCSLQNVTLLKGLSAHNCRTQSDTYKNQCYETTFKKNGNVAQYTSERSLNSSDTEYLWLKAIQMTITCRLIHFYNPSYTPG